MSDILTRLLLNTSDYDTKLKKAKGSTQDFGTAIGGKVAGMVGKFATGIGLAMGGVEAFNKVIQSSQTLGDKWNNSINACKGTVDAFFQSLSSGNWGAFNNGLLGALDNMYRVSALKDMLEDAKLTMGFDTRQFEREYVRLEGIIDDETKGKGEREAAFADMQQLIATFKKRVEETGRGAAETLVEQMNAKFGKDFTLGDIEKYIKEVNNEFLNTETLQRLNKYKETLALFEPGGSRAIAELGGLVLTKKQYQEQNAELEKMRLLQEDNDESRKTMIAQYEYILELMQRADEYLKRSLEKQNKVATLNKVTISANQEPKAVAGSLAAIDAEIKKAQKEYANTASAAAREAAMKTIQELMRMKEMMEFQALVKMPDVGDGKSDSLAALAQMPDMSKLKMPNFKSKKEEIEDMNSALGSTGEIFDSLGGIMSGFGEDMGAWMLGTVGQIAQMIVQLNALATANGVASASKLPFPANIAAIATVVATIASVFSSLPKFAEGGVVGGSSYFGDKLIARVNSGETILTQNQAARALSMMNGGNVRVTGDVRLNGKDIYISLRNYMSASGNKL